MILCWSVRMRKVIIIMAVLVGGLALAVGVLAVGLAYERGHNAGYNDGWYDGRADGWQGCIEENNLYDRYGVELGGDNE